MALKTRRFRELTDDDFMRWNKDDVVPWLNAHHSDPDHAPMDMDYEPLAVAFALALQDYNTKKGIAKTRTSEIAAPSKQLRDTLIGVRRMLPQLFGGNENVLAEFGLVEPISQDDDKMLLAARECRDHWADVSLEPEYAALAFLLNTVAGAITALEDARLASSAAAQARDAAQNTKDFTYRATIDKIAQIFNWYRGLYVSPEDERWQATPFGATYGGSGGSEPGEPGAPEWPDWPGPVEASAVQVGDGWVRITFSGLNGGKTLRIERLRQGDTDYVLVTQGLPLDDPEEVMPFDDTNLDKKKYTYKLTPFDGHGNPGTPLLIEVTVS